MHKSVEAIKTIKIMESPATILVADGIPTTWAQSPPRPVAVADFAKQHGFTWSEEFSGPAQLVDSLSTKNCARKSPMQQTLFNIGAQIAFFKFGEREIANAKAIHEKIVIAPINALVGSGAFYSGSQTILPGTLFVMYPGKIIEGLTKSAYQIGTELPDVTIDGKDYGNFTRFIQHAYKREALDQAYSEIPEAIRNQMACANLKAGQVEFNGHLLPCFMVIKPISSGDQLLFDYGNDYWQGLCIAPKSFHISGAEFHSGGSAAEQLVNFYIFYYFNVKKRKIDRPELHQYLTGIFNDLKKIIETNTNNKVLNYAAAANGFSIYFNNKIKSDTNDLFVSAADKDSFNLIKNEAVQVMAKYRIAGARATVAVMTRENTPPTLPSSPAAVASMNTIRTP